ncbi:MAG: multi antimicrobial extrusion protein MatE [Firmicutes bacterium]|nr:multi antimicrobial extrusion protein MatE [Bacillota bacterium]
MIETVKEKSIVKTFLSYSIPTIIGLFLTSFIIIVDGFFIGWKMGENGLAAVNFTLPVLYILLAITTMIGVGGVTLATQSRGAKQYDRANSYFSFSLAAILVITTIEVLILAVFLSDIVILLGVEGAVYQYVKDFLGVLLYFYLFSMINIAFSMFIRAEGKPQLSLVFGLAGNIINIILDYVFIMRLEWGMNGAAFASGIAALLPFLFGMGYFLSNKSVYRFCLFSVNLSDFKNILINGAAEFISQISISITTAIFNVVLLERLGINGVAAFTIIGYVFFIHSMLITGIAVGIHPVISYNFGAKNTEMIFELMAIAIKAVTLAGLLIFVFSFAIPENIIRLFSRGNAELLQIGEFGLRCISITFLLNGYNFIATVFFTSIGETKIAALVSCLRSLILVVIFLMVLPNVFGDTGIWLTTPLTEVVTFVVAYLLVNRSKEKLSDIQNIG